MIRNFQLFILLIQIGCIVAQETLNISNYQIELEDLEKRVFTNYDPQLPPYDGDKAIKMTLQVHSSHLAVPPGDQATLHFYGAFFYTWQEQKLGWNPADSKKKMKVVVHDQQKLWLPKMMKVVGGIISMVNWEMTWKIGSFLTVDDPNRYQKAKVHFYHEVELQIPCKVSGKYPKETLE
ncbi:unnamed protein product, partial [Mesorhabditis belari]|uniref:Neurotransmitter-gated ion-channel ligand-binding domain-containing protein n=1 Tax=Mesorhabditis belari TaxID=2138241 RepID=A0AAF3F8D6_9BILA